MKIGSININGVQANYKNLQSYILEQNFDILCLQEIRCKQTNLILSRLEKETRGIIFCYAGWEFQGTAILIRNDISKFQIKDIKSSDPFLKNRLSHLQIISKEIINIINVYAPTGHNEERKIFYNSLNKHINKFKNDTIILCGDFNFVENKLDRIGKLISYDIALTKIFDPKIWNLQDVYRTQNQEGKEITCLKSRIDRFYISEFLLTKITNFKHDTYISDHKVIILEINIDTFNKWGKSYWKINNSLFNDKIYENLILETLNNFNYSRPSREWEILKKK